MKKHIRNLILSLCTVLTLTGCGKKAMEEKAHAKCISNIKTIMTGLIAHGWKCPMNLEELTKEGLVSPENLVCPLAKDSSCSYEFLCPGAKLDDLNPDTPVICCRRHKGKTVIGRADASSYTMPGALEITPAANNSPK